MTDKERLPFTAWFLAAACALIMVWLGAESDARGHAFSFTGSKGDYYSLLVAGFVRGHLYLNVEADPGLASPDPKVREHTPTLLDANYYKGHFYLYYGVVPAVLLLLPYHLLTGQDLGINVACLVFWAAGFGAGLYWLRSWWRDFGSKGGAALACVLVVVVAFFPATTFLARRSMFYELPLMAGFTFLSVFFAAIYEVLLGRKILAMLAVASASLGLAVGCHPNHIFLLPLLGWVSLGKGWATSEERTTFRNRILAGVLPAAAVGAGLGWYNYARFGSVFEFGFKYGQNGFFALKESLFVPRFLWTNLKWYLLTPPTITPYFPFIFPGDNTFRPEGYSGAEAMHGQLAATVLCLWIVVGVFSAARKVRVPRQFQSFSIVLGLAFTAAIIFIGFLQIRANRYISDFGTPLAWLMAGWAGLAWISLGTGAWPKLWRTGVAILAAGGSLFYILAAIQQFELFRNTRPASYSALSRALDVPYTWLYGAGANPPGLLSMKVDFLPAKDPVIASLITTGTPGYSDSVIVAQFPNQLVQFSFNHKGYGGPASALIPVDMGEPHRIEISMGSFYPPANDSYFEHFHEQSVRLLKSLAYLRLDGKVVLCATVDFYDAPPWSRQVGGNDTTFTEFKRTFSGKVSDISTASTESLLETLNRTTTSGILRYKIRFPANQPLSGLPFIGVGIQGDGNLVFAKSEGSAGYQVDLDDWGYGVLEGGVFAPTPGNHDLQIVLGPILCKSDVPVSWKGSGDLSTLSDRIIVSLDGKLLGNFKLRHHLSQFSSLTPGANPQGFSTAESNFGGMFEFFPMMDTEVRDLLDQATESAHP